jgi:hypothetical protein
MGRVGGDEDTIAHDFVGIVEEVGPNANGVRGGGLSPDGHPASASLCYHWRMLDLSIRPTRRPVEQ